LEKYLQLADGIIIHSQLYAHFILCKSDFSVGKEASIFSQLIFDGRRGENAEMLTTRLLTSPPLLFF
jgi:hypothetical protein